MVDRSSRPRRSPRRTAGRSSAGSCTCAAAAAGARPDRPAGWACTPSTVHRVLRRGRHAPAGPRRPGHPAASCAGSRCAATSTPSPGRPGPRRHQEARPHPRRRRLARPRPAAGGRNSRSHHAARSRPVIGYGFIHTAVDDHSRLAYTEILADEQAATAAAFWVRAHALFAATASPSSASSPTTAPATGPSIWRRRC